MNILAIDTSTSACSVALLKNDEVKLIHRLAPMQQAKLILPIINEILIESNVTLEDLNALAFGCGPGSFTGVRIATSVMQGLALATQLPIISISSLAAVAQSAYQDLGWKKMLVVMDARMQEVYWGAYTINDKGLAELHGEEHVTPPEQLLAPTGDGWSGIGTGWKEFYERIPFLYEHEDNTRLPVASGVAWLARQKLTNNEVLKPHEAIPSYLRDNVAKKEKEK